MYADYLQNLQNECARTGCEFWETPVGPAVGNSPPFWNESSFGTFSPKFKPEFVVDSFDELAEMEIRSKKGASCRRLRWTDYG
jgi:hypothetical protein